MPAIYLLPATHLFVLFPILLFALFILFCLGSSDSGFYYLVLCVCGACFLPHSYPDHCLGYVDFICDLPSYPMYSSIVSPSYPVLILITLTPVVPLPLRSCLPVLCYAFFPPSYLTACIPWHYLPPPAILILPLPPALPQPAYPTQQPPPTYFVLLLLWCNSYNLVPWCGSVPGIALYQQVTTCNVTWLPAALPLLL